MRRPAVLVAVATFLVGFAVMVPGWLLDDRDYLAVTPQPPAVEDPTEIDVAGDGRICMDRVALDPYSEVARVHLADTRRPVPLQLTITGEDGYFARSRATANHRRADVVSLPVDPPPRSLIATLCLHNQGRGPVSLAAVRDRRRSRSIVLLNGVQYPASFVIQFAEREPVSILERLPASVRRMSVLRPAVASETPLWILLVLFVAGVPIVAFWAFARSLRDDARSGEAPR
jgi:hypothetical protein